MRPRDADRRIWRPLISAIAVLLCPAAAIFLRSFPIFHRVFADGEVRFRGTDAWYHVRLIENLVRNFPHRMTFDPYALHPGGQTVAIAPFFDLLPAAIALLVGIGSPTEGTVHVVCAWIPPLLAAMVVAVAFVLGRCLVNRRAGVIAAAIVAVSPGPFFELSMLGAMDHHVAESCFSLATILLLALSLKSEQSFRARVGWSCAAGAALAAYLLTWVGGAMVPAFLLLWLLLQATLDTLRGRTLGPLCWAILPASVVALALIVCYVGVMPGVQYEAAALIGVAVTTIGLALLLAVMDRFRLRRAYFPLVLLIVAGIGVGGFALAAPGTFRDAVWLVRRFVEPSEGLTVFEARPLLMRQGFFSWWNGWEVFGAGSVFALLALPVFVRRVWRHGRAADSLFLAWAAFTLLITLEQNRFAYYAAPVIAILSAAVIAAAWDRLDERMPSARRAIACFFALLIGAIAIDELRLSWHVAGQPHIPKPGWYGAMHWMRSNTPEPLGNADAYYKRSEAFLSPKTDDSHVIGSVGSYGVLAWWDYGYWITAIGRRIPTANPTQAGAGDTGRFFLAQDEASADEWLRKLDARYVIVDGEMAFFQPPGGGMVLGKFGGVVQYAGERPERFYESYLVKYPDGVLRPVIFYYPEYYRTMCVRLCAFDGRAIVAKDAAWVVKFSTVSGEEGAPQKQVETMQRCATFDEAQKIAASQATADCRIVGIAPGSPCVPLEALRTVRLVHSSTTSANRLTEEAAPAVKIFERVSRDFPP